MFGSKSVHPISGVDSGMNLDRSVWISNLELVLSGLIDMLWIKSERRLFSLLKQIIR